MFAIRLLAALFLFMTAVGYRAPVFAEDEGKSQDAQAAVSFAELKKQLDGALVEVRARRAEYKAATDAEPRATQRAAYRESLKQADVLMADLEVAAEREYAEQPTHHGPLVEFLMNVMKKDISKDAYERPVRISKLLIAGGVHRPDLHEVAGAAFFVTGDIDEGERHLQAARREGGLGELGVKYVDQGGHYRKLWQEEKKFRAAEAKADDLPRVKIETKRGDLVVELFENEAPNTVANFIHLVEQKYYDGLTFHRVLPHFMAQGGQKVEGDRVGPGYTIECECLTQPVHRKHFRGSLSMAKRTPPHTGSAQFFLTMTPTTHLDGAHTVFGRVIEGLDVLSKLRRRNPQNPAAKAGDTIVRMTVLRKREHPYEPKTKPDPTPALSGE